jgi:hypothetical protein
MIGQEGPVDLSARHSVPIGVTINHAPHSNADGAGDLEEVKAYLDKTMTRRARRDFLREQNAWVSGAPGTVLVRLMITS